MATATTSVLPPKFLESETKLYLDTLKDALGTYKTADLGKVYGPKFIAGIDPLQERAEQIAVSGIGAYQPFLTSAAGAEAAAGRLTGPGAYQAFMSPYQQDVIDTTLREFDVQAAKGIPSLAASAISAGAFGGGREGVQRAEYQAASDRNRAALQASLLQQGFGQAQQAAQQAFQQQRQLAAGQLGLGSAGQQFMGQDVGALSTLGGFRRGIEQERLANYQQLERERLERPIRGAQIYGSGITGLISGYPGQTTQVTTPSASPITSALGAGTTLAGIYRAFNPPVR